MSAKILVTTFDTWKSHQKSNSADDLIAQIYQQNLLPSELAASIYLLRKLPVDFQLAPSIVIREVNCLQPDVVICCGMAEKRSLLTVESGATVRGLNLKTKVDINKLVQELTTTKVSHNAGQFVCNALYYEVLEHLNTTDKHGNCHCLFVHVPIFTTTNVQAIAQDFLAILNYFS